MPRFVKKVAAWFMLLVAVLLPAEQAVAASPMQAFTNLMASSGATMSYNSPGQFDSQARHAYSLGGLAIHFPDDTVQFVSIQPPSFSAGCGGISFQFGGFSFISGAQFSQFIQQAAQSALGYAVLLAIKTLCPQCEAVLSALQKLSAAAQKMSTDACHAGQWAASKLANSLWPSHPDPMAAAQKCGDTAADTGVSDNFLNSLASTTCQAINGDLTANINSFFNQEPATEKATDPIGNSTWRALNGLGFLHTSDKELIMSLTGTVVVTASSSTNNIAQQQTGGYKSQPIAPTMKPDQAMTLMMCGTEGFSAGNAISADGKFSVPLPSWYTDFCFKSAGDGQLPKSMLYCADANGPGDCLDVQSELSSVWAAANSSSPISQVGFLAVVYATLEQGVAAVTNNQPIPNDVLALVNSTPFPLYQMMNIAAVYPDVAAQLMDNGSIIVAGMMARAMFTSILQEEGTVQGQATDNGSAGVPSSAKVVHQMQKLLDSLDQANQAALNKIQKNMVVEQMLYSNIQQINRQIQTQVMSQGLAGNQAFAVGVFRGASGAVQ